MGQQAQHEDTGLHRQRRCIRRLGTRTLGQEDQPGAGKAGRQILGLLGQDPDHIWVCFLRSPLDCELPPCLFLAYLPIEKVALRILTIENEGGNLGFRLDLIENDDIPKRTPEHQFAILFNSVC